MAPYAWAKQVNQQDVQEAVRIAQLARNNPIEYLQEFVKDLQTHPTYGAQLKSLAAKALAQRSNPQAQAPPDLNPIALSLEDGRTFSAYSAEQVQALVEKAVAQVEQKFAPVVKTHEQLQADQQAAAQKAQIDHYVTTTYGDIQTWPGMDDKANQVAVANYLRDLKLESDDPREVEILANRAYRTVVLPKLSNKAQSQLLDTLKTKAAASSSVNPGSAGASAPRSPRSFHDTSLQW